MHKERRLRIPEHLPVGEQIIIDPEEVKAEPQALRHMGDEVTEQMDYTPGKFSKRLIIRRKFVKRDEPQKAPIFAELHKLQDRGLPAPGLLAHIIVSKSIKRLGGDALFAWRTSRAASCLSNIIPQILAA